MSNQPIKTDLFRFLTLRSPQMLNHSMVEFAFVEYPNDAGSSFQAALGNGSAAQARRAIGLVARSFMAETRYRNIRSGNPALYDFSQWLSSNGDTLTEAEVLPRIAGLSPVGPAELNTWWDNLLYQCVRQSSAMVRQACIQMIKADHFLRIIQDPALPARLMTLEYPAALEDSMNPMVQMQYILRRAANAKIILPGVFSLKDATPVANAPRVRQFEDHAAIERQRIEISEVQQIQGELELISQDNSFCQLQTVGDVLNSNDAALPLTPETTNFLSNPSVDPSQSVKELAEGLNRKIAAETTQLISKKRRFRSGEIRDNDYQIAVDGVGDIFRPQLGYKVPEGRKIKMIDFEVTVDGSQQFMEQLADPSGEEGEILFAEPFKNHGIPLDGNSQYAFAARITLDDGALMMFAQPDMDPFDVTGGEALENTGQGNDQQQSLPDRQYGVTNIGMGVYRRVEQEVCCYVPGEVSHIENILAKEYKERFTKSATKTEDILEESTEYSEEYKKDTATEERHKLNNAINQVLSDSRQTEAGVNSSMGYDGKLYNFSLDGAFSYGSNLTKTIANNEAREFAEDVTRSASESLTIKNTQKRTSKIIREYEETNRHGFDNRGGDQHVTGIYRWLDIIYTNRLIDYGERMMIEFSIPEPGRFYRMVMAAKNEVAEEPMAEERPVPRHPSELGLHGPEDLIGYDPENRGVTERLYEEEDSRPRSNYHLFESEYNLRIEAPPAKEVMSSILSIENNMHDEKIPINDGGTLDIPEGYMSKSANGTVAFVHNATNRKHTNWVLKVANGQWDVNIVGSSGPSRRYPINDKDSHITVDLGGYQYGQVPVSLRGYRTLSYNITVQLVCELQPQVYVDWQVDNYNRIMAAYEGLMEARKEEKMATDEAIREAQREEPTYGTAANRTMEARELKRAAIEMLMKRWEKQSGVSQGRDFYHLLECESKQTKVPQIKQSAEWEVYSSTVKFLEQAIDWELMTYKFYPYYWASKCDWEELLKLEVANDPLFQSFLQSGMARMVVPVRKLFNDAIMRYLEFGDTWNGGDLIVDTEDDLHMAVADEMSTPVGQVLDEWSTRVPTTLTIVQGDSAYLNDEGLPCCDKHVMEEGPSGLEASTNVLIARDETANNATNV